MIGDEKTKLSLLVDSDGPIGRGGARTRSYADINMKSSAKTAAHQIRVIIADDHPVVLAGLAAMLGSQKDIQSGGCAPARLALYMHVNIREGYKVCAPKEQKSLARGFNPGYPPGKNAP